MSLITLTACPCCSADTIGKVLTCKDYTASGELFEIWECSSCQLRFTQHIPDRDSIGVYYQAEAYISHTDSEKGIINKLYKLARNYTLNWKIKLIRNQTGKKTGHLLDIGAGTGAFVNKAKEEHWSVTGLEPDDGARKIAAEKYRLLLESPEKLFELPSAQFDIVTMWHVLEHVHQLRAYFDEISRVLKKDGTAFIAVPNYNSGDARHYKEYWAAYDVPRHLYHFAPAAISRLTTLHGLKVVEMVPMWLDAFYIAMLSEKYKSGRSNLIPAVWNGAMSNLGALSNKENCSSLVYVIRNN